MLEESGVFYTHDEGEAKQLGLISSKYKCVHVPSGLIIERTVYFHPYHDLLERMVLINHWNKSNDKWKYYAY